MLGKGQENLLRKRNKEFIYPLDNSFIEKPISKSEVNTKNINTYTNQNFTDANSLVEYFHGMLLNYINLEKENNKKLNDETIQLKNMIINHKKGKNNNLKINGGEYYKYNYYTEDNDSINIYYSKGNNIDITYNNYTDNNGESIHDITICYTKNTETDKNIISTLIIDLNNGKIYDDKYKIYKNVYTSSKNINALIKIIIDEFIALPYNYNINVYENYDKTEYTEKNHNKNYLYHSVLSLLIIILSFRNNMDKSIYKKYNYTRFLKDMYENYLNPNNYKFFNNNSNILLTYDTCTNDIYNIFNGDCVLNTLTCVKYKELHELLIEKINMINGNILKQYGNIDYKNHINNVLTLYHNEFYKNSILKYIDGYTEFIKNINNYINYTNEDENPQNILYYYNDSYSKEMVTICNECIMYNSAIISSLIDYGKTIELETYITEDVRNSKDIIDKIKEYKEYFDNTVIPRNIEKFKYIVKQINILLNFYNNIINKYNMNLFYINTLISLYLFYYKVDYLFDVKILKFYNHDNNKKNAINRFCNMSYNVHDIDLIRYNYYNNNKYINYFIDNKEYFFSFLNTSNHAIILILAINPNNFSKSYYICDLNNLNFIVFNSTNIKTSDLIFEDNHFYYNFGTKRYIYSYYMMTKNKYYDDNKLSYNNKNICMDIATLDESDNYYANFCTCEIINNYNIIKYINKVLNNKYNNYYRLLISITMNNDSNYNNFKDFNKNLNKYVKKEILKELTFIPYLIIVDKEECIIDNLLYYIMDLLYNYFLINNRIIPNLGINSNFILNNVDLNTIKLNTFNYMITNKYDDININMLNIYFDTLERKYYYMQVKEIIDNFSANLRVNGLFFGGELLENYKYNCNNVIKKIIIILLIIVIIIIIVLIVLYIINKYKNNSFK